MIDIVKEINRTYRHTMDPNSVTHTLDRDPRVASCRRILMEAKRFDVSAADVVAYYQHLHDVIQGVRAHFVSNPDEMRYQEWADRREQLCFGPASHEEDPVPIPVPRTGKRIMLLVCIAADGSYLKPLIRIPRKASLPCRIHGRRSDNRFPVEWIHEQGNFPSLVSRDIRPRSCPEPHDVRRDGTGGFDSGQLYSAFKRCSRHAVDFQCNHNLSTSSSQFQSGASLGHIHIRDNEAHHLSRYSNGSVKVQSAHIAQVLGSFLSAGSPPNLMGTFRIAGIKFELHGGTLVWDVAPEAARRVFAQVHFGSEDVEEEHIERQLYVEHCAQALIEEEVIQAE
jgi:hypothetical protein